MRGPTIERDVKTFHPTRERAQAIADANAADDHEWNYEVVTTDRGFLVVIHNEEGERVGTL